MRDRALSATEPRLLARSLRRATGMRLTVLLPLFLVTFTIAVGLWSIYLTTGSLGLRRGGQSFAEVQALRERAFLVIGAGGGVALVLGFVLAWSISSPMRQLLRRIEESLPPSLVGPPIRRINEVADLANALNRVLLSFEKYAVSSGMLEHLPEGVLTLGAGGEIRGANGEACRILGAGADALVGANLNEFLESGDARRLPAWQTAAPTTIKRLALRARDGSRAEVEARLVAVRSREWLLTLRDLVQAHAVVQETRRVDQLAVLGSLAASVVHEIGGAIQTVQTLVDLVTPRIPDGSDDRRYVEKIEIELDRVRRLADEIRTLAQVQPREQAPCPIGSIVADAVWIAERRFQQRLIEVRSSIAPSLPAVVGDSDRLHRAVLNVLVNAFEATPDGGRVTVTVGETDGPPGGGRRRGVLVRVANTGSYLPPEERERVFNLFYTTKKEGSGLGLPVAYRAVADHGGTIAIESSREAGTEFTIFLPGSEKAVAV